MPLFTVPRFFCSLAGGLAVILAAGCGSPQAPAEAVVVATPAAAPAPARPSVRMRHRFDPGTRLTYRVTTQASGADQGGVGQEFRLELTADIGIEAVDVLPGGDALLDVTVLHYRLRHTGRLAGLDGAELPVQVGDSNTFPVNIGGVSETVVEDGRVKLYRDGLLVGQTGSRNPLARGVADAFHELAPRMHGSRAELRHSPDGRCAVLKRSGDFFKASLADGPGLFPVSLLGLVAPDRPVGPGDAWTVGYALDLAQGEPGLACGRLPGAVTYTVRPGAAAGRPGSVVVGLADVLKYAGPPQKAAFKLLNKTYEREVLGMERDGRGEVVFDPAAGQVLAARVQVTQALHSRHPMPGGEPVPHLDHLDSTTTLTLIDRR